MLGVLYVQMLLFKLKLNVSGTFVFEKFYGKFCFVNYFLSKKTVTLKMKKQVASPER